MPVLDSKDGGGRAPPYKPHEGGQAMKMATALKRAPHWLLLASSIDSLPYGVRRKHDAPLWGSPSKVLLFFGNFVPLARRRDPVKEGQGCRWHWGKYSNRLWNSDRSV